MNIPISKKTYHPNLHCPCGSGQAYIDCCQPIHQGQIPQSALQLMRSRYSAYAMCLADYIIDTTHPANPQFQKDHATWKKNITEFCTHTHFIRLEILEDIENEQTASVTFTAHLVQNDHNASFTEKSIFEKIRGKWFYKSGQIIKSFL